MTRPGCLLAALSAIAFVPSCRKEEPPPQAEMVDPLREQAVQRCANGIEKAAAASHFEDAMRIYHGECADLYTKAPCRDAWRAAAAPGATNQGPAIADACRKAYCPDLTAVPLDLCLADFPLAGPRFDAAWAQFFNTVLEREGGESLTPALLTFLVRLAALKAQGSGGDASTTPPVSSGVHPGGSSAPPAASLAPRGSALPASGAPKGAPAAVPPGKTAAKSH